jgi:hypothetical protein
MDVIGFLCVSLGSSTVQLHDRLRSRCACVYSEAGFSSRYILPKSTVLLRFLGWGKRTQCKYINKEMFHVYGGQCLLRKTIQNWVEKFSQGRSKVMPDQVRKWLRNQSKDLYAACFDALVKRWDKCINVGG